MKKVIIRQINSSDLNIGDIHPVLNRIYQTRGVKTEEDIKYDLKNLLSYKGLLNIDKATSILYESLLKKDKIIIVGDYDADGLARFVSYLSSRFVFYSVCRSLYDSVLCSRL